MQWSAAVAVVAAFAVAMLLGRTRASFLATLLFAAAFAVLVDRLWLMTLNLTEPAFISSELAARVVLNAIESILLDAGILLALGVLIELRHRAGEARK